MVVEAIEEGPITGLGITPERIQGFLIRQSLQVVEGVSHRLGRHCMKECLQPHGAVHRDHPTASPQIAAEGAIVEVMHPACDPVLLGKQLDQRGVIVVAPIPGMMFKGQMV